MARPLRILHVQYSLEPGGMENGVVNVARALQPRGFEFQVACLATSGEFASRLPDPELVHVLQKPEGFSFRTVVRLFKLIRRLDPDVIHSHNLGALIYSVNATFFGRKRPILHGEHGQPDDGPDAERRAGQRRRYFKSARQIHTVSQGLLDHFLRAGFPKNKLVAIINGVDTERFSPGEHERIRREFDIPLGVPVLLIVGRLIASKKHRLLFEAFERVVTRHPGARLLVVGSGGRDERSVREAAAASSAAKNIYMEGFKEDPRPYYHAADLLVAPSEIEGLSNVVLEAMSCGLPPLLHDACGSNDLIDPDVDGIVTDLTSADKISSAIGSLLADRNRLKQMGRRSRDKVVERFSLQKMADAYEQIYRDLAAERC